jgi:broad specificity phosphatase PhoE
MGKDEDIRVFMLQAAPTEWDESERVAGAADLPLTDGATAQIEQIAEAFRDATISSVLCGTDEASRTAADLIGQTTGAKVRQLEGLCETDLGLWQGLRRQDLVEKFPTAWRQWLDDPCAVTAPEGEGMREAADRIISALSRGLDRHRAVGQSIAVVLRPVAYGLVTCWLDGRDVSELWSVISYTPEHEWRTIPREVVRGGREGIKAAI